MAKQRPPGVGKKQRRRENKESKRLKATESARQAVQKPRVEDRPEDTHLDAETRAFRKRARLLLHQETLAETGLTLAQLQEVGRKKAQIGISQAELKAQIKKALGKKLDFDGSKSSWNKLRRAIRELVEEALKAPPTDEAQQTEETSPEAPSTAETQKPSLTTLQKGASPEDVKAFCEQLKEGEIIYVEGRVPVKFRRYQNYPGSTRIFGVLLNVTEDQQVEDVDEETFRKALSEGGRPIVLDVERYSVSKEPVEGELKTPLTLEEIEALAIGSLIYADGIRPAQLLRAKHNINYREIDEKKQLGECESSPFVGIFLTLEPLHGKAIEVKLPDMSQLPKGASPEDFLAFIMQLEQGQRIFLSGKLTLRYSHAYAGTQDPPNLYVTLDQDDTQREMQIVPLQYHLTLKPIGQTNIRPLQREDLERTEPGSILFQFGINPVLFLQQNGPYTFFRRITDASSAGEREEVYTGNTFFTSESLEPSWIREDPGMRVHFTEILRTELHRTLRGCTRGNTIWLNGEKRTFLEWDGEILIHADWYNSGSERMNELNPLYDHVEIL